MRWALKIIGLLFLLNATVNLGAFFRPCYANCTLWLTNHPRKTINQLPSYFPRSVRHSSPLSELLTIRQGDFIQSSPQDFSLQAHFAYRALANNYLIPDHLQWVMAQSLVASAKALWTGQGIAFQMAHQSYENHILSYLELLPGDHTPANLLAKKLKEKYDGLRIIYHPYHLIHQNLNAAYEINSHQVYLGHKTVANITPRDFSFLHELRHAQQRIFLREKIPSPLYGDTSSTAPLQEGESIYHRMISHDELLIYFKQIKTLLYQWRHSPARGHWHRYQRLGNILRDYTRQALFISKKLEMIAQTWPLAIKAKTATVTYQAQQNYIEATLQMEIDGRQRITRLPLIPLQTTHDIHRKHVLLQQLYDLYTASVYFRKFFTALYSFLANTSDKKFDKHDQKRFAKFEKRLYQPFPTSSFDRPSMLAAKTAEKRPLSKASKPHKNESR